MHQIVWITSRNRQRRRHDNSPWLCGVFSPRVWVFWLLLQLPVVVSGWTFTDFRFDSEGWCTHPQRFTYQNQEFVMRNVPGDGDCLFTAVLSAAAHGMGLDFQLPSSSSSSSDRILSRTTRDVVATILQTPGTLWISQGKSVTSHQLLRSAARELNVLPSQYLKLLRTPGREGGLYGGGPELTVLSNWLRREIAIYEIESSSSFESESSISNQQDNNNSTLETISRTMQQQTMVLRGVFGENVFVDSLPQDSAVRNSRLPFGHDWRIHILIVDTNPTEKHACVLLPAANRRRRS